MADTAASGCTGLARRPFSMNEGDIVLPPDVTMKSRARSTRRNVPSVHAPMSPFLQPAILMFDDVDHHCANSIRRDRAAHQDFAVRRQKTHIPAMRSGADIARPRKLATLSRNDAAGFFGLTIDFKHIDAVHMPKRRRFGRQLLGAPPLMTSSKQSRSELVEDRAKSPHDRRGRLPHLPQSACRPRVCGHGGGQDASQIRNCYVSAPKNWRYRRQPGQQTLAQVARNGEEHGRGDLEDRGLPPDPRTSRTRHQP